MEEILKDYLNRFNQIKEKLSQQYKVVDHAEYIFSLYPKQSSKTLSAHPCFMALVHGNEPGGLLPLLDFMDLLQKQIIQPSHPLSMALGNPKAYLAQKRFIHADLNRCFGLSSNEQKEDHYEVSRAPQIQKALDLSTHLIDLHQTQCPTEKPFCLIHEKRESLHFARYVLGGHPLVFFKSKNKKPGPATSTRYMLNRDKLAFTLELGYRGFSSEQSYSGLTALIKTLDYTQNISLPENEEVSVCGEIYQLKEQVLRPEGPGNLLDHIKNFQFVNKGEEIGHFSNSPLKAPAAGYLLFPKFTEGPKKVQVAPKEPLVLILDKENN